MVVNTLKKQVACVVNRVIFIGFCIQIALGVFWMFSAFARLHSFGKGIVCVTEMLLFSKAVWFALGTGESKKKWFHVLCVLSFPMVLQCFFKVEFRLLSAAVLLIGLGLLRRAVEKKRAEKTRRVLISSAVVMLCVSLLLGYFQLREVDLLTRVAKRTIWTTLFHNYGRLSDEDQEFIVYEDAMNAGHEAVGIETILIPSMEATMGKEESRVILKKMIAISLGIHKSRIAKEIVWDEAGYLFSPLVVRLQLSGRAYESYTGRNFRELLLPAPKLGSFYMRYSCLWFEFALVLRLVMWGLNGCRFRKLPFVYCLITMVGMATLYTFSGAGNMDYKNTIYILCVWLIWIVDCEEIRKKEAADDEKEL